MRAEFWAHFLSPDTRGKGIGAISWFKACQPLLRYVAAVANAAVLPRAEGQCLRKPFIKESFRSSS